MIASFVCAALIPVFVIAVVKAIKILDTNDKSPLPVWTLLLAAGIGFIPTVNACVALVLGIGNIVLWFIVLLSSGWFKNSFLNKDIFKGE